jgi:hypothetical protein
LQEVDDCHAMVGGDEDAFGQCGSFLTWGWSCFGEYYFSFRR